MNKLSDSEAEQRALDAFSAFVDADTMQPSKKTDAKILGRIQSDLQPSPWLVFGKFTAIEAASGITTLFFCPQFGLGFGQHSEFFHGLHLLVDAFSFYVICGLIFISTGAALSALLLSYNEIQSIRKSKYAYYMAFAIFASLSFSVLGSGVILMSIIAWVIGAFIGNSIMFELVSRLRFSFMAMK
jgi:hypothetical protein